MILQLVLNIFLMYALFPLFGAERAGSDYYFKQVGIEQGLSQSTVNCILCDARGVMWIGTALGLNAVEKNEVRTYLHEKDNPFSLPGNQINFIAEDSLNNIWVSTNRGLVRYERDKNSFCEAIPGHPVYTFSACPTAGGILFGGERAIYKYLYKEKRVVQLPLVLPEDIRYIEFNRMFSLDRNTLLISSKNGGLWLYGLDDYILRSNLANPLVEINTAAYVDSRGRLYISPYKKGLYCLDYRGNELYHLNSGNSELNNDIILDIAERDGKLWLATDGGGINILDMNDLTFSHIRHIPGDQGSLPVNSITCLYIDRGNNVWAGSVRGGMFGIKEVYIKTYKDVPLGNSNGLSDKTVISLFQDRGGVLWIGTDGGGINRYHPWQNHFTHYASTYGKKVVSVTDYSEEELMLSFFSEGIYLFNKKTGDCRPFEVVNPEINRLECTTGFSVLAHRVSADEIYFLGRHIYIYSLKKKTFSRVVTDEEESLLQGQRLVYAGDSSVYLVRTNRIYEVRRGENKLRTVYETQKEEVIHAVCYDGKGKFWIGSDSGLSGYDRNTGKFRSVPTNFFNSILALTLDRQGRLWIGAQNMLFSYVIAENRFVVWGESDGFSPNELYFIPPLAGSSGPVYMGGIAGLVKINEHISYTSYSLPRIKLTDVILNGVSCWEQTERAESSLEIPWNYTSFSLKVISDEKDVFRKALFRYKIKGLRTSLTETYNSSFALPLLSPGTYSVMCSCNTRSGEWTPFTEILIFTVTPPWFQTSWFIFGSLFLVVLIIGIGFFLIIQKKENRLKWQMHEHELEVNEEKIHFLINVSHELRTPLTLIYAPLKRLLDDSGKWDREYVTGQLERIRKQAWRMKNIINMVLDMDKMKSCPLKLQKSFRRLNEWVKEVTENFRDEFENKRIVVTYRLDERIGSVSFDTGKCEIVLSNLLMNALKFSPPDTEIRIFTEQKNGFVRISVADEGIGLDHLDVHRLFDRFYQGNHHILGSGIGLSYAWTLVHMWGGKIDAVKNEGGGAVFYFELPETAEEDRPGEAFFYSPEKIGEEKKEGAGIGTGRLYALLLVEDEKDLLDFLKEALKDSFKQIYTAANGKEALQKIRDFHPDIVVSDVMMPGMDGYQLCQAVKEDIDISHIPVILLTAIGDEESISLGYKLGADAYIPKPFELDFLLTVIGNLLKNRENVKARYKNEAGFPGAGEVTISNADERFMSKLNRLIEENLSNPELNVNFLLERMSMSRASLYQKMKALTDMGVNDYINRFRIERAVDLLTRTDLSITEISEEVGFAYQRYFSSVFKQMKGVIPSRFRQQVKKKKG